MSTFRNKVEDVIEALGLEAQLVLDLDAILVDPVNTPPSQLLLALTEYKPELFEPFEIRNRAVLARLARIVLLP